MTAPQLAMLEEARGLYGEVTPCSGRTLEQSFTLEGGVTLFWFNDAGGNTHVVARRELARG